MRAGQVHEVTTKYRRLFGVVKQVVPIADGYLIDFEFEDYDYIGKVATFYYTENQYRVSSGNQHRREE